MNQFIITEEDANRLLFHFTKTPHVYEEIIPYVQILFNLKPSQSDVVEEAPEVKKKDDKQEDKK